MTSSLLAGRLIAFLRDRFDEEDAAALAAAGAPWEAPIPPMVHVSPAAIRDNKLQWGNLGYVATVQNDADREHIVRWNPARVHDHVESRRRILDASEFVIGQGFTGGMYLDYVLNTLRLLAMPYSDHPDHPTGSAGAP